MNLTEALDKRSAWHQKMSQKQHWPLWRANWDGFESDDQKADYLVTSNIEKPSHFETRRRLTQFMGCTPAIADRLIGRVFQDRPEVDYSAGENPNPLEETVKQWAEDMDGSGLTLDKWIKDKADNAMKMGAFGVFVDKIGGEFSDRSAEEAAGADKLRLICYEPEEIIDGEIDEQGRIVWVKLRKFVERQPDPLSKPAKYIEWLILDRENATVYRADIEDGATMNFEQSADGSFIMVGDTKHKEPTLITQAAHGAGCVPFEIYYGDKLDTLQGVTPLRGGIRADLATLNADSTASWQEWLHGNQVLVIETERDVQKVFLDGNSIMKLNPGAAEKAEYLTNDAASFGHMREVVESRKLDAHRMIGADPVGLFEGSASPEAGVAKERRFSASEERVLARFAEQTQAFHTRILELATRRFSPTIPALEDKAFGGSVRYAAKFDLADADTVLGAWLEVKPEFATLSPTLVEYMDTRIALLLMGDSPRDKREQVAEEIQAAPRNSQNSPNSFDMSESE